MGTGIFLSLHYTSDLNSAYFSIFFLIRQVYYGWCLRYLHSSGASFVFLFQFLHLGRAIFYGSYFYNPNTFFSGIVLLFFLMAIAFMGYVLPFGQMGFWGILSSQSNIEEVLSLSFSTPISPLWFYNSSNNPLRLNTNNKIPFFPFILLKDLIGLLLVF